MTNKKFDITEDQEWQLFELLEGNLSLEASIQLLREIDNNEALKFHYNALKLTYISEDQKFHRIEFTEKEALKRKPKNNRVAFWWISTAAAAISILLIWNPFDSFITHTNSNNTLTQATANPNEINRQEKRNSLKSNPADKIAKSTLPMANTAGHKQFKQNNIVEIATTKVHNRPNDGIIHPLILATETIHPKNIRLVVSEGHISNIDGSTSLAQSSSNQANQNGSAKPEDQNPSIDTKQHNGNTTVRFVNHNQKTKAQLAKSFYFDARRMIENGHLPHVKIKTVKNEEDWIPEFQVGITLENNVILTSFNPNH